MQAHIPDFHPDVAALWPCAAFHSIHDLGVAYVSMPPAGDDQGTMRYVCAVCSTPLILPASKIGASGPCPVCRTWIEGSKFVAHVAPVRQAPARIPSTTAAARKRMQPAAGRKGRIQADGYLDHEYNERRELFSTLRVFAVFFLVAAVILFITLYLRRWMME